MYFLLLHGMVNQGNGGNFTFLQNSLPVHLSYHVAKKMTKTHLEELLAELILCKF